MVESVAIKRSKERSRVTKEFPLKTHFLTSPIVEEVLPDCWLTDAFSHVELRYKEGGTEKNLSLRREISTPVDFS